MLAIIGLFQLHNWRIALVTASLFESQIDTKGLDLCELESLVASCRGPCKSTLSVIDNVFEGAIYVTIVVRPADAMVDVDGQTSGQWLCVACGGRRAPPRVRYSTWQGASTS
jgi:hypothetical protein